MPPQGCDLVVPVDKLYLLFSNKKNLPLVARLCKLLFESEFGCKNKHHLWKFYSSLFPCVVLIFTKQNSSNSDCSNLLAGRYCQVFILSLLRPFICHVVCTKSVLNPYASCSVHGCVKIWQTFWTWK